MSDPKKILANVETSRTSGIWETISDEAKSEARKLAELYRTEPEEITRRGWSRVAKIYGARWGRPNLSGPGLKGLVERLLDESEKNTRRR